MRFPSRPGFVCFVAAAMAAGLAVGSGCASRPSPAESKSFHQPESKAGGGAKPGQDAASAATAGAAAPASAGGEAVSTAGASASAGGVGVSAGGASASVGGGAVSTAGAPASAGGVGVSPGGASASVGGGPVSTAGASASASADGGAAATGGASAPHGEPVVRGATQTSDERRAAIDKQLNDSLGSFDAKLRKEQQKIAQERDARQATVTTAAATDAAGQPPGAEQSAAAVGSAAAEDPDTPASSRKGPNSRRGESRTARTGDLKSDKAAGGANGNAAGNGAVANEIPDGNDDDVVARRLRKAAEQETDPELKDKLWKEYVEYKKNT